MTSCSEKGREFIIIGTEAGSTGFRGQRPLTCGRVEIGKPVGQRTGRICEKKGETQTNIKDEKVDAVRMVSLMLWFPNRHFSRVFFRAKL